MPEGGIEINLPEFGQTRADMADLLLTDAVGVPQPLAKISTRPGGHVILLAQYLKPKSDYFLYFGGNQVRNSPAWTPKLSLFMETRRAPANLKMDTLQDITNAWTAATEVDGAGFVSRIFHGDNPFGFSYNFLTHYTGWLFISKPRPITFYTISSDPSFVLVNDQFEFGWPGQHNMWTNLEAVRKKSIQCPAGMMKIDYYAAKGAMIFGDRRDEPAMVFGWQGDHGGYGIVESNAWLHPGTTDLLKIEAPHNLPVPMPTAVADSYLGYGGEWFYEATLGFQLPPKQLANWTATWKFEDGAVVPGLSAKRVIAGQKPELVTVTLTQGAVSLTEVVRVDCTDWRLRAASVRTPADVRRYIDLMEADTPSQLKPDSLAARLAFLLEWGTDQEIAKLADAWPQQDQTINDSPYGITWVNARLVAIRTRAQTDPAKALSELNALEPIVRKRFPFATAPLEIDLHVYYLHDADSAGRLGQIAFLYPVSDLAKTAKIRVGDLYRVLGRYKEAIAQYQSLGIKVDEKAMPAQDRACSITIRDLLENGFRSEAQTKLNEWELKHPMAKFDSDFLLLRAQTLMLFGRWSEALTELESFEKVQPDNAFQIDAEFYRARVLYEQGKKDEARKIWINLAKSYPKHPLSPQATTWAAKP